MIRPQFQLHPFQEPVKPRPAATVMLLRDEGGRLEVLMTQRSPKASFMPNVFVFPGGAVDAGETFEQAAVRECMEELAIDIDIHTLRFQSHWITDRDMPKRFDVHFYVAPMPLGQTAVADEQEQFRPTWINPKEALARVKDGSFPMIFPTIRTVEWLAKFDASAKVLAACEQNIPHWVSCPRSGETKQGHEGKMGWYMESDPAYGELAMVCPDGVRRHTLEWRHNQAIPLLKHVKRITCANPSMMTGPGTNTYLIGLPATGYVVIDAGPWGYADLKAGLTDGVAPTPNEAERAHVKAIYDATNGDIRAILCTHSHPDHSPASAALQGLCKAASRPVPSVFGMASGSQARAHSDFTPDVAIADGWRYVLNHADLTITLRAVHTPGHAANHLCYVLEEDGLLVSGDHILNGSTTVIDPPDGNMAEYLDSLDKLSAACAQFDIEFILPAHGYVLGFAKDAIAKLKAHRLGREAKVLAALQKLGWQAQDANTPDKLKELVPHAYDDVDSKLWPVALRSLLAHVQKLQGL